MGAHTHTHTPIKLIYRYAGKLGTFLHTQIHTHAYSGKIHWYIVYTGIMKLSAKNTFCLLTTWVLCYRFGYRSY